MPRATLGDEFDPYARVRRGRTSKLNEETILTVANMVRAGNYIETACAAAGISQGSYYNWIGRGKETIRKHGEDIDQWPSPLQGGPDNYDVLCVQFLWVMKQASAEAEAFAVTIVRKAMGSHWQAAMTYLERKHPGRWKRRDEISVSALAEGDNEHRTGIDEQKLLADPDAQRLMHEALAAVTGSTLQLPSVTETVVDAEVVDDESTA